jgi:hypothetical protein
MLQLDDSPAIENGGLSSALSDIKRVNQFLGHSTWHSTSIAFRVVALNRDGARDLSG